MQRTAAIATQTRPRTLALPAMLLFALLVGCDRDPNGPAPVASVRVAPDAVTLQVNETRQLNATLHTASGAPISGPQITWSSSDTLVATVSATGLITARAAGPATITATSEGKHGRATVTVSAPSPLVELIEFDITTAEIEEGEALQLTATPRDAQGNPITGLGIQWTTSDESIARIAWGGQVTAIRTGTATITARVHGKEASATVTVTASYPYDLLYAGVAGQSNVEIFRRDIRDAAGQPMRLLPANTPAGMPRPSPDGGRIAFLAAVQGQPGIYVVNRDGSGLRAIVTAGGGSLGAFSWSPDGTRIAYHWQQAGEQWGQIWAANVVGEPNPVSLTADLGDARVRMPAWSPQLADGTSRIAYVHQINGVVARLWTMRPDGSDKRQITTGDYHDDYPAWRPDGETIVFERIGMGSALWLVNRTGGNLRHLYSGAGTSRQVDPAWSPDGKLIAFATRIQSHGEGGELYQIQTVWADGSKLARRTFSETTSRNPAWLPRP